MRFHIHRREWGDVFEESWKRLKDQYRWYTPPAYLNGGVDPETHERYVRYFQHGTCVVCGHVEKREVSA